MNYEEYWFMHIFRFPVSPIFQRGSKGRVLLIVIVIVLLIHGFAGRVTGFAFYSSWSGRGAFPREAAAETLSYSEIRGNILRKVEKPNAEWLHACLLVGSSICQSVYDIF